MEEPKEIWARIWEHAWLGQEVRSIGQQREEGPSQKRCLSPKLKIWPHRRALELRAQKEHTCKQFFSLNKSNLAIPCPEWTHNPTVSPVLALTHYSTRCTQLSIIKSVQVTCWRNKEETSALASKMRQFLHRNLKNIHEFHSRDSAMFPSNGHCDERGVNGTSFYLQWRHHLLSSVIKWPPHVS